MASGPIAITRPSTSVSRPTPLEFGARIVNYGRCANDSRVRGNDRSPIFRFWRKTISYLVRNSAFDAEHLLQGMHYLNQIGLVRHHLVDVLVCARNLIEHALVLAADDTLRLHFQISDRELLL